MGWGSTAWIFYKLQNKFLTESLRLVQGVLSRFPFAQPFPLDQNSTSIVVIRYASFCAETTTWFPPSILLTLSPFLSPSFLLSQTIISLKILTTSLLPSTIFGMLFNWVFPYCCMGNYVSMDTIIMLSWIWMIFLNILGLASYQAVWGGWKKHFSSSPHCLGTMLILTSEQSSKK